jgi:hypothetical protein
VCLKSDSRPVGPARSTARTHAGPEVFGARYHNLIQALDGVPPDKLHCPALAIAALKDALAHWPDPRKEPT